MRPTMGLTVADFLCLCLCLYLKSWTSYAYAYTYLVKLQRNYLGKILASISNTCTSHRNNCCLNIIDTLKSSHFPHFPHFPPWMPSLTSLIPLSTTEWTTNVDDKMDSGCSDIDKQMRSYRNDDMAIRISVRAPMNVSHVYRYVLSINDHSA